MLGYVEETVDTGAAVETSSETVPMDGVADSLVVVPMVLSNVTNDMSAAYFEHFVLSAPIIEFSTVDKAIATHDDTEYSLSGSVPSVTSAPDCRLLNDWTLR